jgi:mercuric ion binding protein
MKSLKYLLVIVMAITLINNTSAQTATSKTDKIKVSGNCGMCKERIEKAVKVDGVTKADWDKSTKILTVSYNSSVIKNEEIQKKVAAVGHDTEKFKADDKTYNSLHSCCKYR